MMIYIVIINYDEGTYISQLKGDNEIKKILIKEWYDKFKTENISNLGNNILKQIKERIVLEDYNPIVLNGMDNVWCNDLGIIEGQYFSMTIVGHS
ncbi:hypothetical protein [Aquimarina sp. 2201CG14-23]|uniref:hypothetical protein n=1 Tax=Aquimarina mycalae TaxID=3040073 RepID=UPI0024781EFC|nr:hypothetical protein [Aquimarina sp. 2201CG14-23]MDH7447321.1 hypothetical protein [Aquimarina sp. 2201CG14-23]